MEIFKAQSSWYARVGTEEFYPNGRRKMKAIRLAPVDKAHPTAESVRPIASAVEKDQTLAGHTLAQFLDQVYWKHAEANLQPSTIRGYRQVWDMVRKRFGNCGMSDLPTSEVTKFLTGLSAGYGKSSVAHVKAFLSSVFKHAEALGVVTRNPIRPAQCLNKLPAAQEQPRYTEEEVILMLAALEEKHLRAAVVIGLGFYAALRPSEIRGLRWEDLEAGQLNVRRRVWHNHVGPLKTERSYNTVPICGALQYLLDKLKAVSAMDGYVVRGENGGPLNLDLLGQRVIKPILAVNGIAWKGYYGLRRGASSLVADRSNPLVAARFLRNSPVVNMQHYTRVLPATLVAAINPVKASQ
jgi:integrase